MGADGLEHPLVMNRNPPSSDQKGPSQTRKISDQEASSYFLIRRRTNDSSGLYPSPPTFHTSNSGTAISPAARSQNTPNTTKSAESSKNKRARRKEDSAGSSPSVTSKYRCIQEWNDRSSSGISPGAGSPVSFEAPRYPVDPPRPPKAGFEWVWFPEGYWAERQVHNIPAGDIRGSISQHSSVPKQSTQPRPKWWNRSSEKSKVSSTHAQVDETHAGAQGTKVGSLVFRHGRQSVSEGGKKSRRGSKIESSDVSKLRGVESMKSETDVSTWNQQPETLGLFSRTKKHIQKRLSIVTSTTKAPSSVYGTSLTNGKASSHTATVLEGATSYFNQHHQGSTGSPTPTIHCACSPAATEGKSRRVFGLAPWHRKNSHSSLLSVSSSVYQLLMGRVPAPTPASTTTLERKYAGNEGKTYTRVEISTPGPYGTTFLPSEAKRIDTPPLSTGTPNVGARSFFFDLNVARNPLSRTVSPASSDGSGNALGRIKLSPSAREWWESGGRQTGVGSEAIEKWTRDGGPLAPLSSFELSLPPDHLPSSPLCPRNPLHASGGTGICPFHGRDKSVKSKANGMKSTNSNGTSGSGR